MDLNDRPELAPILSSKEREELTSIAYFLGQLERMRARALLTEEAYATVVGEAVARREEIERAGRYEAAMARARHIVAANPTDALAWTEQARGIDPGRAEAWEVAIGALERLGRHKEALALCEEGAQRFPALAARLETLQKTPGAAIEEALDQWSFFVPACGSCHP